MKSLIFILAKMTAAFLVYLLLRVLVLSLFPVNGMRGLGNEDPLIYIFAAALFYFLLEFSYLLSRLIIKEHSIGQALLNGIITGVIMYFVSAWNPYFISFSVTAEKIVVIIPFFITAFIYPLLVIGIRMAFAKSN